MDETRQKTVGFGLFKTEASSFSFFFKGVISGDNSNVLLKNKYRSKTGPSLGTVPLKA